MKIAVNNLFNNIPSAAHAEVFTTLLEKGNIRIERIISGGQGSQDGEWYDQEQDEWVLLLQGYSRLLIEGQEEISLESGDYLFLPAHCRHRVTFTSGEPPCIWLALHIDRDGKP